jgi:hypothetical protein
VTGLLFACLIAAGPLPADAAWDAGATEGGAAAADGGVLEAGPEVAPEATPPAPPPAVETVRLSGQVLAKGTREPLVGASIAVDAVPRAEAGEGGRFEVEVPAGRHRLQIQHPGYEPVDDLLETSGLMPERTYRLMPRQTGERYETTVAAPDSRAQRIVLREEDLTQVPGSFGDPFRVIESLPGVSQVAWPLAIYAIRGANPGNSGFFIDGVRVPSLFHFALGPSAIHPFLIQQLDFYPGGYPAEYGRFAAGIVHATTSNPPTDRPHYSVDIRGIDSGAMVVAPFNENRGSVAAAARISYTGLILSALSSNIDFNYWDYQLRLEHRLGPGKLTVFAFGSNDYLLADDPNAQAIARMNQFNRANTQQKADLSFHRLHLRWSTPLLGGALTTGLLFGRDASATLLDPISSLPISQKMLLLAPKLRYTRSLAWWAEIEAGADAEFQDFDPTSAIPDVAMNQDLFRDRNVEQGGAYLGFTFRSRSRLVISPAMRYEAFWEEGVQRFEPSPRLNLRFRPGGEVWLKGSIGRYAQLASLSLQVPGFESFGLKTYGPQWSWQTSAGVEAPLPGVLTLDVTLFYQRFQLTDLESIFNYDPQRGNIVERRDGESYGVEVMVRRPLTQRLSGWLAYTLSKSDRLIGYYRQRAASDWDQRHILNLVMGYRFRAGWAASGRVHYNTGRPYPVYKECTARVDYQRLPPFFQVDWRVDKRFVFDKFVLSAYVELVNSTLTREVYDLKRRCDDTLESKGFKIVLPSLGVHAEW